MFISKNKSLKELSTFGIGGKAAYFAQVTSEEMLREALLFAAEKKLPYYVIGKGSNTLFPDCDLPGLLIQNRISYVTIEGEIVEAGSGYSFSLLGSKTARCGLSGLEFASGIPASVGGAVYMNAGANGKETKDTLMEVAFLESGEKRVFTKKELSFSYRMSPFQKMRGVILSAKFCLKKDPSAKEAQSEIIAYRKKMQPLQEKSAGCVFRNPSGDVAASFLIDDCGLKGRRVGGAEVSSKHANFIVNAGGATQKDVLDLIALIEKEVLDKRGIHLEKELRVFQDG